MICVVDLIFNLYVRYVGRVGDYITGIGSPIYNFHGKGLYFIYFVVFRQGEHT